MKIDLHVHSVANQYLDSPFNYSSECMKTYVNSNEYDVIAITNHNLFDETNFKQIKEDLSDLNVKVFPGIEISLEEGHILVIADDANDDIDKLKAISREIHNNEFDDHYRMSISDFNNLVCGNNFIIIPHYKKFPAISDETISKINDCIKCGEVDSIKHYFKLKKEGSYVPLYFSDIRIGLSDHRENYKDKSRFTYLKCDCKNFKKIKESLENPKFVYVGANEEDYIFDILNGSAKGFNGINVLLGKRSSGKTYSLNHISEENNSSTLYIKQFEITKECSDSQFHELSKINEQNLILESCRGLINIFDYVDKNIKSENLKLSDYINSLKGNAHDSVSDFFSKLPLFNYEPYSANSSLNKKTICSAILTLLKTDKEDKMIINKYITDESLSNMFKAFIYRYREEYKYDKLKEQVNIICESISNSLSFNSSAIQIKDCNFETLFKERYIKKKFNDLINNFKEHIVSETFICEKFWKKVTLFRQTNKTKMKSILGVSQLNKIDYLTDLDPFSAYLQAIQDVNIKSGSGDYRYRLFFDYDVKISNQNKSEISGGQRAEFVLLNKLNDYQKYDLVLIDEMESSFDNPFLNKEIVSIVKKISNKCIVFLSTHNNNLGVSLNPDFYIYHSIKNGNYVRYYGRSNDEYLVEVGGDKIKLVDVLLETMEASDVAYKERNKKYENNGD